MTIEDQIKDEKLQYDINREVAKISALSSGKLDKYEYLTGEEILPSNQQQIIQQAKFTYSPLEKPLEKQRKTIEDQGEKQVVALESLKDSDKKLIPIKDFIPKENLNPEIINEIKRIEEIEKNVDRNKMVYKGTNETYDFRNFKTIRAFGNEIRNNIITLDTANLQQANLLSYINDFIRKTKPRNPEKRKLRSDVLDSVSSIVKGRAFQSGIFHKLEESQKGKGANEMSRVNASERLKILTPNQMLKRLPIALAQVKAGNNSESLLNEIRHIVYSLYRSKEFTKKVYNNVINSIKKYKHNTKMDTIFMNSENSKTSEHHVLVLKLTDKLDLRRGQETIALSNLSIYYTWKNVKSSYNNNKFKISAPTWSEEFELPDGSHSVSDIQDYFEHILKKHSETVDNPSIRVYINRIENRITFKIKNGYYLELLIPETMKLLGSTESKITKDKNGENVPHLEVAELVLVH